jgi:hypothetical protein
VTDLVDEDLVEERAHAREQVLMVLQQPLCPLRELEERDGAHELSRREQRERERLRQVRHHLHGVLDRRGRRPELEVEPEERDDLLEDARVVRLFEVGEVARLERAVLAEPLEPAAVEQIVDPPLLALVRARDRDEPVDERRRVAERALREVPLLERPRIDFLAGPGNRRCLPEVLEPLLASRERAVLQVGLAVPLANEREIALAERPPLRAGSAVKRRGSSMDPRYHPIGRFVNRRDAGRADHFRRSARMRRMSPKQRVAMIARPTATTTPPCHGMGRG